MPMRDGIRLATDIYRPARDGELVEGRYPTILCRTPYDKTDKRYSEIADFFVPHGYSVCLRTAATATAPRARRVLPRRDAAQGEDGYDTSSGSPSSAGRTAVSARWARRTPGSRRSGWRSSGRRT